MSAVNRPLVHDPRRGRRRGALDPASHLPRKQSRRRVHREAVTGWLLMLPALAIIVIFKILPLASGIRTSLELNGQYAGLHNYALQLHDPIWHASLLNLVKGIILLPVYILAPLVIAVLLFRKVRGWRIFRALYLCSYLIPAAMTGLMFSLILGENGPAAVLLKSIGISGSVAVLPANTSTSMWAVYAVVFWAWMGLGALTYLAGLALVPAEQYEAARLDGAGFWTELRRITIPEIRPTMGYWSVVMTAGLFLWLFPFIVTLTNGGPGYSSMTPEVYAYNVFSQGQQPEYASSLGVTLFILVVVASVFQVRVMYSKANAA